MTPNNLKLLLMIIYLSDGGQSKSFVVIWYHLKSFKSWCDKICHIIDMQCSFLSKIQNHISEKTRRKIILLSFKKFVKTQFLGVVEFPSIFWIQFFKVVVFPSNFWFQKFKVVVFPSNFWFQNVKVVVFPSNFWKTTIIWQFFRVILNFSQECYNFLNSCIFFSFFFWFLN